MKTENKMEDCGL